MDLIILDPEKITATPLRLGFNHTPERILNPLLIELKPRVMRTLFNREDVRKSYEVGAEPFVGIRFMPKEISLSGNRESPPTCYSLWEEYVADTVSDILRDGMKPKYYSVWNEPERREEPIFWEGTMEEYIRLFEHSSRALKKADPSSFIGGPETTGYEPLWTQHLINSSIEKRFDLDFLSFHQFEDPPRIRENAKMAKKKFKDAKGYEPEIHIGEWGFKIKNAFLAHQHLACAEEAGVGFYCKDFFFEKKWKCSVIDDKHRKRDMFYFLAEYSKLGHKRVSWKSSNSLLKIIGSPTNDGIRLIISSRSDVLKSLECRLQTPDNKPLEIISVEEITENGVVPSDITLNHFGAISICPGRVYLLNGGIRQIYK